MTRARIATPHHLASAAGMRAMAAGGSAVDAALAAAAALTVVYPHNCALGGDLLAILREPTGEATVINATGPAPAAIDVDRLRAGGSMPITGADAATVPGLVAGWGKLHAAAGRLSWAAAFDQAIACAHDGFTITEGLAAAIAATPGTLDDPGMRAVLAPGGSPLQAGERLVQPALARTLSELAAGGASAFYEGPLAARLVEGLRRLGSTIAAEDLAGFAPRVEAPLRVDLGDCELLTAGPNSSGILLAQALLALRASGVAAPLGSDAGFLAAVFLHGNRQRERELGDPLVVQQDVEAWIGPSAIDELVREATAVAAGQRSIAAYESGPRPTGDTIAIVAVDDEGRAVSLIQSLFHFFGAQLLEPDTGILLHNRGAGFALDPDHPNALAPGSRPAHTLMPVVVERDGSLLGVLGAMGGKLQAQVHTQVLLRLLDGFHPQEAVAAPRFAVGAFVTGDSPATVRADAGCAASTQDALRAAGLTSTAMSDAGDIGHAQVIWCETADGRPQAGSDPRADGL